MNGSQKISRRTSSQGHVKRLLLTSCSIALGAFLLTSPAQAALDLAIEAAPDPVQPGEIMYVTLTVTNPGGVASGAVTLQMPFLAELDPLSEALISDGGDCPSTTCDPLETVSWSLGSLPAGGGVTVSLPPTVQSGDGAPPDGTVLNFSAEVFEDGVSRATADRAVTVRPVRILELAIDEAADPIAAGADLKYALTYVNRTLTDIANAELRCPRPTGTTFVSASDGGVLVGDEVVWELGTLYGRDGGRREVVFRVDGGVSEGTLLEVDLATLTRDGSSSPQPARARAVTRVENDTPLGLGMAVGPDPALPGGLLQVELTVSNRSADFLTGVTLELHFPKGLSSLDGTLVSDGGACPSTTCDVGETLSWALGTLAPGQGLTVTLPPSVQEAPPRAALISFAAELTAAGGSNALRSQTVQVHRKPVLELTLDERPDPVAAGETFTYTLTYSNSSRGTTTIESVLRLPLPAGATFVSATDGGVLTGGAVVWNIIVTFGGEGERRQATFRADAGLPEGTLFEVDAATLTGEGAFDPFTYQARAREATRVENGNPLDLSMAFRPDSALPGELLQGQITVANRSAAPLSGVTLELHYPDLLTPLSDALITDGGDCPGDACDPAETVRWTLNTLAPGTGVTVSLPPMVDPGIDSPEDDGLLMPFTAEVSAADGRSALAGHTLLLRMQRELEVAVAVNRDPVAHGEELTYTATYGNRHLFRTTNTGLRLPLPAGTTFVSATADGVVIDGAVVWNLGTVLGREGGRRQATVAIDDDVAEGAILTVDGATIAGRGPQSIYHGRTEFSSRVKDDTPLAVSIAATPNPVLPGGVLDTAVTVTNQSGAPLTNVMVQLRYPDELLPLDESLISDGGDCIGATCDAAELVTWSLGTLNAGAVRTLTLSPTVLSDSNILPQGSLIPYWVHARADSAPQAVHTHYTLVNDDIDEGEDLIIFVDAFESGDTSAWSATVP